MKGRGGPLCAACFRGESRGRRTEVLRAASVAGLQSTAVSGLSQNKQQKQTKKKGGGGGKIITAASIAFRSVGVHSPATPALAGNE
jgi:hypothetical protein